MKQNMGLLQRKTGVRLRTRAREGHEGGLNERGRLGEISRFERLACFVKASGIAFLRTTLAKDQKDTETVHYKLAVSCLDYLKGSFGDLAFLQYADSFWSTHLDKAGSQMDGHGMAALALAAHNGHSTTVERLLQCEEIGIESSADSL
ncbi:uncharacterized protein G6M90_00g015370 [Metarhizium brunneum]|uniref:Uncharacterized protein n=1 Tax=Metarhizium brunneum TaxID=500148 RepID=A0A7D5YW08_9HYPO|nr:hypothetical protein G6M90_00g015370 [Metarhizium brunneum]